MRLRLPKQVSSKLGLKGGEVFNIEISGDKVFIYRSKKVNISSDLVIKDMANRSMHSKVKITSKLLERWKEEM